MILEDLYAEEIEPLVPSGTPFTPVVTANRPESYGGFKKTAVRVSPLTH